MEYLSFACALVIGLIMGLTGAGGAILSVPVLVYLTHIEPVVATAYSLFIVGTTSAFGTLQNLRNKSVNIKMALLFATPSLVGVYCSRRFIVPAIPDPVFSFNDVVVAKATLLMTLFAVIMLVAAISMLRGVKEANAPAAKVRNPMLLSVQLLFAGIIVGLVGAGGGFLFVPILIFVAKLPIKKAAATSLMIIAINSLVGFTGDLPHLVIDWKFLLSFTAFAVAGIFIGIYLNKYINETRLKKGFGWFVLIMGIFILVKEIAF